MELSCRLQVQHGEVDRNFLIKRQGVPSSDFNQKWIRHYVCTAVGVGSRAYTKGKTKQ